MINLYILFLRDVHSHFERRIYGFSSLKNFFVGIYVVQTRIGEIFMLYVYAWPLCFLPSCHCMSSVSSSLIDSL